MIRLSCLQYKTEDTMKSEHLRMAQITPFHDLLDMIDKRNNLRVVDLGCGSGIFTRKLADNLLDSDVLGIDSSPEMIREAQACAGHGIRFEKTSIEEFVAWDTKYDVIFSNAALQLVDNHYSILPNLIKRIAPGGQLAVQMVAIDFLVYNNMEGISFRSPLLTPETYVNILLNNGGTDVKVFDRDHPEFFTWDTEVLYEYICANIFSTFLQKLSQEQHEAFKEGYKKALLREYPQKLLFFQQRSLFLSAKF